MNDYFDLYKKCYSHYYHKKKARHIFPRNRHKEFHEEIIKSYFNIYYIKFFYLLQKDIKLNKNIYNISVLINIFMNLYDNSNIYCNKNIKIIFSLIIINRVILSLIHVRSSVAVRCKELVLCTLITSVFRVL